jgi:hypothetical protein
LDTDEHDMIEHTLPFPQLNCTPGSATLLVKLNLHTNRIRTGGIDSGLFRYLPL